MCVIETVVLVRPDGSRLEQPYQRLCEDSHGGRPCQNVTYHDLGERALPSAGGVARPSPGPPPSMGAYVGSTDSTPSPLQPSHSRSGSDNSKDMAKPKDSSKNYWVRDKPTKFGFNLFKRNSKGGKSDDSKRKGKDAEIIPDPPPRRPTAPVPPPAVPNWGQAPPPPPPPIVGRPSEPQPGRWHLPSSPVAHRLSFPPESSSQNSFQPSPTFPPQSGRTSAEPLYEVRDPPHRRLSNASRQSLPRRPNVIHQSSAQTPAGDSNRYSSATPPHSATGSSPSGSIPPYNPYRPVTPPSTIYPSPPLKPQQRQSAPEDIHRAANWVPPAPLHRPSASQPTARKSSNSPPNLTASTKSNTNTSSGKQSATQSEPKPSTSTEPNPDDEIALRASHREARRLERERNDLSAALRAREAELEQAKRDLEQEKARNRASAEARPSPSNPQTHGRNASNSSNTSSYPHPLRGNPPRPQESHPRPSDPSPAFAARERDYQRELHQLREEERTAVRARIARLERETSDLRRKREAAQDALVAQIEEDERAAESRRPQLGRAPPPPPSVASNKRRPSPPRRAASTREREQGHRRPAHHSDGDFDYGHGGRRRSSVAFDVPPAGGSFGQAFRWRASNVSVPEGLRRSNTFSSGSRGVQPAPPPRQPPPQRTSRSSRDWYGGGLDDDDDDMDGDGYGSESVLRARDKEARRQRKDRRREDKRFWP